MLDAALLLGPLLRHHLQSGAYSPPWSIFLLRSIFGAISLVPPWTGSSLTTLGAFNSVVAAGTSKWLQVCRRKTNPRFWRRPRAAVLASGGT